MSNVVEYDANKNPVASVTVFQQNRAEVKRKVEVKLEDGQNEVEVRNLPSCIEESSIRVDGIGKASILDVVYHPPQRKSTTEKEISLRSLHDQKDHITSNLKILEHQSTVLKEFSRTMTGKDTDATQLEAYLDLYAMRKGKLNAEMKKLMDSRDEVDAEINKKTKEMDTDEESARKRGVRVTIVVMADGAGDVELSLTYVVTGASWELEYDLRASLASDVKDESKARHVSLHYRAAIKQATGEGWTNIALSVSTAMPLVGAAIPSLSPIWIPEPQPVYRAHRIETSYSRGMSQPIPGMIGPMPTIIQAPGRRSRSYDSDHSRRSRRSRSPVYHRVATVNDTPESPPPDFFPTNNSSPKGGALSTTFSIPGLSNIPSMSETAHQTHKVSIAELHFDSVDLEWVAVPKDILSVFLRCIIKNTSKYVLLPGNTNVFLNGNFVSKSAIVHVSPQEKFSCSLGVDPAIRITYHPRVKKTKTSGGSILSKKTVIKTTTFDQAITVKNTRLFTLPRLIIKDQIHVSRDSRIKVNLLRPTGLSQSEEKQVAVKDRVVARWAKGDDEGLLADKGSSDASSEEQNTNRAQGLLEWVCEVAGGTSTQVSLIWEVCAPPEVKWERD